MAHEILSVKLLELDEKIEKLHSRIYMSETLDRNRLQKEIAAMNTECAESGIILQKKLRRSKSKMVSVLSQSYMQIEQIIQDTQKQIQNIAEQEGDSERLAEEKILLAEYALDFAHQAADRALLLSMEAINTQLTCQ